MTVPILINHIKRGIGNDKIVLVLIILFVFVVKNPIAKHEQMSDNHYVYRTTDSIITVNIWHKIKKTEEWNSTNTKRNEIVGKQREKVKFS